MKKTVSRFAGFILLAVFIILASPLIIRGEADLSLSAASAVAMDFETGEILYEKDAYSPRVPASMTKIMTVFIVFEEMEKGNLALDTMIPVSPYAARISRDGNYPMAIPLESGGSYSVDDLIKLMMIPSASAACIAAAEYISGSEAAFVDRMNETAASLGMYAEFTNCHGAIAHNTSAYSIALLIREFIQRYPDIIRYSSMVSVDFKGVSYGNTNRLLSAYYYEGADGFKTGTIPEAGFCLSASAVRDGRRIITVVMKSANTDLRHTDSIKVLDYGFEELKRRDALRDSAGFVIIAPESVRLGADFDVQAEIMGIDSPMGFHGRWDINGREAEAIEGILMEPDQKLSLRHYITDADRGGVEIKLIMYMPGGGIREWSDTVPVSSEEPAAYRDISGSWAESYIARMSGMGVLAGTGKGYFSPYDNATMAMAVSVLGRLAEKTGLESIPEADGPNTAYYDKYYAWAEDKGIIAGEAVFPGPGGFLDWKTAALLINSFAGAYGVAFEDPAPARGLADDDLIVTREELSALIGRLAERLP